METVELQHLTPELCLRSVVSLNLRIRLDWNVRDRTVTRLPLSFRLAIVCRALCGFAFNRHERQV